MHRLKFVLLLEFLEFFEPIAKTARLALPPPENESTLEYFDLPGSDRFPRADTSAIFGNEIGARASPFIRPSFKVPCNFYLGDGFHGDIRSPNSKQGSLEFFDDIQYFYSEWSVNNGKLSPFEFPGMLRGVAHPNLLRLYHECELSTTTGQYQGKTWTALTSGQLTEVLPKRFEHLSSHLFEGYDKLDHHGKDKRFLFLTVFYELFDTLDYMHNSPIGAIGHGDLKWQNVMLDASNGNVKVMDPDLWFLLQSRYHKMKEPHQYCTHESKASLKMGGTVHQPGHHISSECCFKDSLVGVQSDIFAAGQLIILALGGRPLALRWRKSDPPPAGWLVSSEVERAETGRIFLSLDTELVDMHFPGLSKMIFQCLDMNDDLRPTAGAMRRQLEQIRKYLYKIQEWNEIRSDLASHRCGLVPPMTGDAELARSSPENVVDNTFDKQLNMASVVHGQRQLSTKNVTQSEQAFVDALNLGGKDGSNAGKNNCAKATVSVQLGGGVVVAAAPILGRADIRVSVRHGNRTVGCPLRLVEGRGSCKLKSWNPVNAVLELKGEKLCDYARIFRFQESESEYSLEDSKQYGMNKAPLPWNHLPTDRTFGGELKFFDRGMSLHTINGQNVSAGEQIRHDIGAHQIFQIAGHVTIPSGLQVVVREGTKFVFDGYGSSLRVEGQLITHGSAAHPVEIVSLPSTVNEIYVSDGASASFSDTIISGVRLKVVDARLTVNRVAMVDGVVNAVHALRSVVMIIDSYISRVRTAGEFYDSFVRIDGSHFVEVSKGFTFQGQFAPLSPLLTGSWFEKGDAKSREYTYYLKDYVSTASFSRIRDSYLINGDDNAVTVDRADVILERIFIRGWLHAGVFAQGAASVLIIDSTVGRCFDAVSLGQGSPRLTALHSNLFHSGTGVKLAHNTTNASASVSRSYLHTNSVPIESASSARNPNVKCSYVGPVDLGDRQDHPQCIVDLANLSKVRRIWNTHALDQVVDIKPYENSYVKIYNGDFPQGYQADCGIRFWASMTLEVEENFKFII